jgi:hypothetical protein
MEKFRFTPSRLKQKARTTNRTDLSNRMMCRDLPVKRVRETCAMHSETVCVHLLGNSLQIAEIFHMELRPWRGTALSSVLPVFRIERPLAIEVLETKSALSNDINLWN